MGKQANRGNVMMSLNTMASDIALKHLIPVSSCILLFLLGKRCWVAGDCQDQSPNALVPARQAEGGKMRLMG